MAQETFLDRLKQEHSELNDRSKKLYQFVNSDAIANLSRANQILLREQLQHMEGYLGVLVVRLELLEK